MKKDRVNSLWRMDMKFEDGMVTNEDDMFKKIVLTNEQVKAIELVIEQYLLRNQRN